MFTEAPKMDMFLSVYSALRKLILHVHVRCWDYTIVPVSELEDTLEDMGKMYQSPTVKLNGSLGHHILLLVMRHDIDVMRKAGVHVIIIMVSELCVFYYRQLPSYLIISFRINSMALWQS